MFHTSRCDRQHLPDRDCDCVRGDYGRVRVKVLGGPVRGRISWKRGLLSMCWKPLVPPKRSSVEGENVAEGGKSSLLFSPPVIWRFSGPRLEI